MVSIRMASLEDAPALYDLEVETFSVPWSLASIKEEIENPVAVYLVACEDEKIIGYAGIWCVCEEGQITNVAVHKSYRQQGIGNRLVDALFSYGEERQLTQYFLEVRKSNEPAISLYKKVGFKEVGCRKNYYSKPTEDALLMGCLAK